jgi:predicted membrane channel-forming protein YqfA (hemolysin III family)
MDITNLVQGALTSEALFFAGSPQTALGMVTFLNVLVGYVVLLFWRKKINQVEFIAVLAIGFIVVQFVIKLYALGGH